MRCFTLASSSNGLPFLQFNAATSSGMSGGPVINTQGEVVGTVSFNPSGETQSFNFAAGRSGHC
ncbi:MAG: S1C family serine protease [Dermatophilaceae bacterium]